MEKIKMEILQRMQEALSDQQFLKLKNVLEIVLQDHAAEEGKQEIVPGNTNELIIRQFIASKKLEGLSYSTLEQYHRAILNMVETVGKQIVDIETNDIRYYLSMYQEKRKVSKVTINNMRRYFSTFFGWCTDEDIIQKNPMRRIKQIKQEKTVKEPFSEIEMEQLRQAAKKVRDRALVEFLYSTGCRVSEVMRIDLKDVDFVHNSVVVTGKGNKQREVYITEKAMYWLKKYLSERKDNVSALFTGKGKKRLGKPGIEAVLTKIGQTAGISKVHPHRFRRTIATNLINKGMPIQDVQQILGHSSLDTTMIYCKVDKENVKAAHKKYAA